VDAAATVDAASAGRLSEPALAEDLRAAGLRATQPRLRVLRLLRELGGHRSVDDLVAALRERGTPLPRASIYNVVDDFVERGLALGADAGPGRALYEASETPHHHFVCLDCGAVLDVPCVVGDRPCLEAGLPGIEVYEAQVIFRGRCPSCVVQDTTCGSSAADRR